MLMVELLNKINRVFFKIDCVSLVLLSPRSSVSHGLFCQNRASLSCFDPFKIKSVSLVGDFGFYSMLAILFC